MALNPTLGGENTYYIGDRAFYQCLTNLSASTTVFIPSSVIEISDQALMGYSKNLVVDIGSSSNLSQLDLLESIEHNESDNFSRIEALTINFYTDKYSSGADIVIGSYPVSHYLTGTLNIL